ncbi:MAG: lipopolysaccharide heptosyltransferase II [Candidatus Omnitrophota bacterium]|nr:lipopolysaccharide heptosyltransferase II [Candidatus Omnitrophota bacterium]MBU1894616.1 lipopolysaccharide heptosyltransferase II [Candidatus Omnitrophota bacterium]
MLNNPKKIVIMRTDRIGEVLLSTVVVDSIKTLYPSVEISFVTSEYSRQILENRCDISEILTVDTFSKDKWFLNALKLACTLRKRHFSGAIILNAHKLLHLAVFLAGIPVRVGYKRKWGWLLNQAIEDKRNEGTKHEIEYAMDFMRLVGFSGAVPVPSLISDKTSEEFVEGLLAEKKVQDKDTLIVLHPASSNPAKMWSKESYARLIKYLKVRLNCVVALIGSREEKNLVNDIVTKCEEEVIDFSGELNLKQLISLLKRAKLFIGNDSGPMHMAAALDVPVVAIFGRKIPGVSPGRWRPWGDKHIVFHKDAGCVTCYDRECPHGYKCLKAVTVDEVFEAVIRLVGQG